MNVSVQDIVDSGCLQRERLTLFAIVVSIGFSVSEELRGMTGARHPAQGLCQTFDAFHKGRQSLMSPLETERGKKVRLVLELTAWRGLSLVSSRFRSFTLLLHKAVVIAGKSLLCKMLKRIAHNEHV